MSNESSPSFIPGRRWSIGLSVVVSCLALLAIVLMLNYLGARHFSRFQWAQETQHQLSPMTLRLLEAITNKVDVVVMFDRRDDLYRSVSGLISEYRQASQNLKVEWIDYVMSPARAEVVTSQYKLAHAPDRNRIIFHHNGTIRVVDAERELSEFDTSGLFEGKEIKRVAFKGEQLFTSAIYSVLDAKEPKAYFLNGHGEHDFSQTDNMGYSKFARILQENRIGVGEISLLVNDIPADCNLLVIAAPTHPIAREELEKIERYLIQGGRVLALFNVQGIARKTGLESLLAKWGVEVGSDTVMDEPQSGQREVVVATDFANHPIVNPLVRPRLRLGLLMPRSVSQSSASPQSADPPRVTELVFTSSEGVARPLAGRVRTGAIPMMAAVEKGTIQGVNVDRGTTRIVVMGESMFLSNQWIDAEANRDLAHLAVNWLLNRDLLIEEIGPRPIREYQITLTKAQMKGLQWMLLGGMPGAVFFAGLIVWVRRRS
jgi:ABC-2 type transport system permease protein